jgi:hypothetical protein
MTWLEAFITFLQVAAILSGAAFAALALFTDYKKDGKVTRYGRLSVVGIALSALCSLGTQWGQSKLTARRGEEAASAALAQRQQEAQRFNQQMHRLGGLATNLNQLNGASVKLNQRAEESLRQLAAVQARVGQSLFATRQIGAQNQRNTAQVLRTMWDDANRINASSLAVTVNYSCGPVTGDFPRLMDDGATMVVRVARLTDRQRAGLSPTGFHTSLLLDSGGAATFRSAEQRITVSRAPTVDGAQVDQVARFTAFQSPNLGQFSDPANWRGAVVEAIIFTYQPNLLAAAAAATPDLELGGRADVANHYDLTNVRSDDDYSLSMLDCPVQMTLVVNGRFVATAEGRIVHVNEHDEDVRGLVVVKFPIVPVDAAAFSTFGAAAARR